MRYAMIMAGGAGTRLWPLSRQALPKQLTPLPGGATLLELATRRLEGVVDQSRTLICAAERHRSAIRAALPALSDAQILGEPVGRDTINAIALTAAVLAKSDPDAVFAVFPSDHLIKPVEGFQRAVRAGFELAEQSPERRLVTISIAPTEPATQFGYIERGEALESAEAPGSAFAVERYVEKPDLKTARSYVEAGTFGWSGGMFVWRARTILRAIGELKPECHEGVQRIARDWGTPRQQKTLAQVYPKLPKISIDFAVMEPASNRDDFEVCTILADLEWADVGNWSTYAQLIDADDQGVRLGGAGANSCALLDCADTLVVNTDPNHTVAAIGLQGFVVINTPDATLIVPAADTGRIKELHAKLPDDLK